MSEDQKHKTAFCVSGYLYRLSEAIVDSMNLKETLDVDKDLLKVITKPFTELIIQVTGLFFNNLRLISDYLLFSIYAVRNFSTLILNYL